MNTAQIRRFLWVAISISTALMSINAPAQDRTPIDLDKARVVEFWTPERRAAAIPRDLVIDSRGLGYLRHPDGSLRPYGHKIPAVETARTLPPSPFAKPGGGGSGGGGGGGTTTTVIKNAEWTAGGTVQKATGRILFAMAGTYYVCSGTVVTDDAGDARSIVATAAHCVYDDVKKAFATNVMFIPDQAHTTSGSKTDSNCNNDPMGCWVPSFGVVDVNWTLRTFPDNIPWDYAFYVVKDNGAHQGTGSYSALDAATGTLGLSFALPNADKAGTNIDYTHALGYSYRFDPKFMYCAQDMTTNGEANWWLPNCGLSGGSSGGPWIQPMASGNGPIISVNSWGYQGAPGMAGPKFSGNSAACVYDRAKIRAFTGLLTPNGGGAGATVTWSSDGCSAD